MSKLCIIPKRTRVCRRCGTREGFFGQRMMRVASQKLLMTSEICVDCESELDDDGLLDEYYRHLDRARQHHEAQQVSVVEQEATKPRRGKQVQFKTQVEVIPLDRHFTEKEQQSPRRLDRPPAHCCTRR